MNRLKISCINKTDRMNPHERIKSVGGINNSIRWKLSQEDAIRQIKTGVTSFYVEVNSKSVDVIVAISRYGNEYLKTKDDGEQPNNLLSLPECPLY